ncbi:hypothetical protein HKD37_04G010714 [Glycine soja]
MAAQEISDKIVSNYLSSASTIHNVPYTDDVVRAIGTFVGWPTNLVKAVSNEDSQKRMPKRVTYVGMDNAVATVDPLGELVKNLYYVYQKPIQLPWDGMKFGLHNVKEGFFISHANVTEIILGDKCLNISILQLWMMAHWQLIVLCPQDNIVVWLCSLRKKPDVNIKGAVNSAMKTLANSLEGKVDQAVPMMD